MTHNVTDGVRIIIPTFYPRAVITGPMVTYRTTPMVTCMMAPANETMKLQLPSEKVILQELRDDGRHLPSTMANNIDFTKKHITRRLGHLEDYGLVDNLGGGLYEITPLGKIALEYIDEYSHGSNDKFELMIRRKLDDSKDIDDE